MSTPDFSFVREVAYYLLAPVVIISLITKREREIERAYLVSLEVRISPHPGQEGSKKLRSRWRQVEQSGLSRGGWLTGWSRGAAV